MKSVPLACRLQRCRRSTIASRSFFFCVWYCHQRARAYQSSFPKFKSWCKVTSTGFAGPVRPRVAGGSKGGKSLKAAKLRCRFSSTHLSLSELQGLIKIAQRRVARANLLLKLRHPHDIANCRQPIFADFTRTKHVVSRQHPCTPNHRIFTAGMHALHKSADGPDERISR